MALPSLLNPSQPVTQLCGSFLEGFQCLNVPVNLGCSKLSEVFWKAKLRVGICRIKKVLLPLRHTVFVLCVHPVYHKVFLKILFVTKLHHIFISTSESSLIHLDLSWNLWFPHIVPPCFSVSITKAWINYNNVSSLLSSAFNMAIRCILSRRRHIYHRGSLHRGGGCTSGHIVFVGVVKLRLKHLFRN